VEWQLLIYVYTILMSVGRNFWMFHTSRPPDFPQSDEPVNGASDQPSILYIFRVMVWKLLRFGLPIPPPSLKARNARGRGGETNFGLAVG
jgi:hypothetical protein